MLEENKKSLREFVGQEPVVLAAVLPRGNGEYYHELYGFLLEEHISPAPFYLVRGISGDYGPLHPVLYKGRKLLIVDKDLDDDAPFLISKRLATVALIKGGKSYREIGKILWISPGTVSAIKKSIYLPANYKSSRYYCGRNKSEKIKRMKGIPPETIFDYWARLPIPKKSYIVRRRF